MFDRMRDRNIDSEWRERCKKREKWFNVQTVEATGEAHLVDVFQFVNDLVYYGVRSLHFDFRVHTLSLDPVTDHTEGVAVNKAQRGQ